MVFDLAKMEGGGNLSRLRTLPKVVTCLIKKLKKFVSYSNSVLFYFLFMS